MVANNSELKKYLFINVIPLFLLMIWVSAIFSSFLNPISEGFSILSLLFMKMFSSVCHQDQDKSLLLGKEIYVCARCAGIYTGSFLSALILIFGINIKFDNLRLLAITSVLLMADVLLVNIGVYEYSHSISFSTGTFFGLVVYQFLISTMKGFISESY